ncbi:DUF2125 domain-containing protein [Tropicimonas sp. S265A]|uniref:DUF2125 domain-containing protein n=1 Tax=Tropicimonas sp. S265A TaxID=3415134 RepID=UPI003C7C4DA2
MSIRLSLTACVLSGSVLAGVTLATTPATALTAPELWEEWQEALTSLGQEVAIANRTYSNGVLRLEGITQRMPIDPEVGRNITVIDGLVLTEQTDGSVRIDLDGGYRIDFGGTADGERSEGTLNLVFTGLDSVARGEPGSLVYDFAANLAQLTLDRLAVNDEDLPITFQMAANELASVTTQTGQTYAGQGSIAAVALAVTADDQQGNAIKLDYGLTDLTFSGSANYAEFASMGVGDPAAVFRAETPTALKTQHGPASFTLDTRGPSGGGTISGRAESGALEGEFGKGRALYAANVKGMILDVASADLPVPVNLTADEIGFRVDGPMLAGAEPQPFSAALALLGLSIPEALWATVDPGGLLARDPASLVLELSGLAQLDKDLTGPVDPEDPAPGDVLALALEQLDLSAAGAQATANGAFAMDPNAPPAMPGMPPLSGKLNVEMRGLSGFINNLITLGLLDPTNAMGAQMMLGMLARPAPGGGDVLTSEIEVSPSGGITANGQRIR